MIEVSLRVPDDRDLSGMVKRLEESGIPPGSIEVLTREPLPHSVFPPPPSRMSRIGVIGALLGFTAAVAGLVTVTLSVHMRTGGMPLIAPLPLGVITYEMTLLAAVLAIVLTLLLGARLGPRRRVAHHPELAAGEAIVSVTCTQTDQASRARELLAALRDAPGHVVAPLLLLLLFAPALRGGSAAAQTFQTSCAPCHGNQGEGRIGPQIAGRTWAPAAFTTRVRQGGLVMPGFSPRDISDAQLAALLAYVERLPAPAAVQLLPSPVASAPGRSTFEGTCLGCHGAEARGGIAPGILNTSLTLSQVTQRVRRGGGMMPPFPPDRVSDRQIREVYAYLHPPLPRPDPGAVDPLPTVPNYLADSLFVLAALALLLQVASERRRRLTARVRAEAITVAERFPDTEDDRLRVRAF